MIELNTTDGSPVKRVTATITITVDFNVGGKDDDDRVDSVIELFDDHYDDIADNCFLRNGLASMQLTEVKIEGGNYLRI